MEKEGKRCGVEGLSLHPLLMVMDRRAPLHLALTGRKLGDGEKSTNGSVDVFALKCSKLSTVQCNSWLANERVV